MIDREAIHGGPEHSELAWIVKQEEQHCDAADPAQLQKATFWSAPELRRGPREGYYLVGCLDAATGAGFSAIPAGSLVVVDFENADLPGIPSVTAQGSVLIGHRMLDRHLNRSDWPGRTLILRADDPACALVVDYVSGVARHQHRLTDPQRQVVLEGLCRLIAMAAANVEPAHGDSAGRQAVKRARLNRLKRVIHDRLSDPSLSAATLARALNISSRNIHLLFEASGETFAEYVRTERLMLCRMALTSPAEDSRSVTDIAFGSGFANLTTFYRAFRAAFGVTPLQMRARASLFSTSTHSLSSAPDTSDRPSSSSQAPF